MKIATSNISVAQAEHNLALEISPRERLIRSRRAPRRYGQAAGPITVQGANNDQLTTLYSDLYRAQPISGTMRRRTWHSGSHPDYLHSSLTGGVVNGKWT